MQNRILFINAAPREQSRTRQLADIVLNKLGGSVTEEKIYEYVFPQTTEFFLKSRDDAAAHGDFSNPLFRYARDFAEADIVVIAAPFWDMSFPASLKAYIEHINVVGLTFGYSPEGIPLGLCKAKALIYVTSCGGNIGREGHTFGYGYVKYLAKLVYGIKHTALISAEGLDIAGADIGAIMAAAAEEAGRKTDEIIKKAEL